MRVAFAWLLGLGALACFGMLIVYDNHLWHHRRPGAPWWKIFLGPWRWLSASAYTDEGNRYRRRVWRVYWLGLVLALAALGLGQC